MGKAILVADPDQTFLGSLKTGAEVSGATDQLIIAATGTAVADHLKDASKDILAVFINPRISEPNGITVIRSAREHRSNVLIFVIYDSTVTPFDEQEMKRLGISQLLQKPVTFSRLMGLALAQQPSLTADSDESYFRVQAENLLSSGDSEFDIFHREAPGQYAQVLKAGEPFSSEEMVRCIRKGVDVYFLRKSDQERFLSYYDQLTSESLKDKATPIEMKVSQTLQYGEDTLRFLKSHGFQESQLKHAVRFVDQVNSLATQLRVEKNATFKKFLSSIGACEHGTGVAIVASLAAPSLKISDETALRAIGVASLFHDIGLTHMPLALQDEDVSKMTEEQKAVFRTHPTIGAQILRTIKGIDPGAIDIVIRHHDRLDSKGFNLGMAKMTIEAELIGISDEFVRLIQLKKVHPRLEPLEEMEKKVFGGYSPSVVSAFRNFFFLTLLK